MQQRSFEQFLRRIKSKQARIGIIGLGYVGLPVATGFADAGFTVTGFDVDRRKVQMLLRGKSYIEDIKSSETARLIKSGKLKATTDFSRLGGQDAVIICVPTPLAKSKSPDVSFILEAATSVKKYMRKGMLVILESTTYPGTTEEVVLPLLEAGGWQAGKDFYLCFSPERIDPGNKIYDFRRIPKVVGGVTGRCGRLAALLYQSIVAEVHRVSSARSAEMAKLLENTFRIINIGLINELAMVSQRLGVDIWEAIEAAKTKPFGFLPFYPGPGIGGHCIGIDPVYLSWKAKMHDTEVRLIDLASQINTSMPEYVVRRIGEILNQQGKAVHNAKLLFLGVSYKRDVADMRESPALAVIEDMIALGAKVSYYDPFVAQFVHNTVKLKSVSWPSVTALKKYDLAVITTDHTTVDYERLVASGVMIFDTRNVLRSFKNRRNIIKL